MPRRRSSATIDACKGGVSFGGTGCRTAAFDLVARDEPVPDAFSINANNHRS
jgi:hypothetical protein